MSDPLRFEPDYVGWACFWDPEGPIGRGKTKEIALGDLFDQCDDDHRGPLRRGATVIKVAEGVRGTGLGFYPRSPKDNPPF